MGKEIDKMRNDIPSICGYSKTTLKIIQLICFLVGICANAFSTDVRIAKTTVKISNGGNMVLKNNLTVTSEALVWNEGAVHLINDHETTLNINTILNGEGTYYINGNAGCIIEGEGAAVSSLNIESGNTVYVTNDFSVTGILTLESGVVKVTEGASLKIQDTSAGSIVFDDYYGNTSFIEGTLERNTIANGEYVFPLGSVSKGFHPFKAGQVSSSGYLGVKYRGDYADTWNGVNHNGVTLEDIGGWEVSSASGGITFLPYMSLYTPTGLMNGVYNLFYTAEPDAASPDFLLDYNSITSDGESYLTSKTPGVAGLFAVSKIKTVPNEEGEEEIPELVNFLAQNGTGRTTFEVQGIEEYKNVVLLVYDRFGNKVYESNDYANDFDSKNYRPGTYYYELVLVTDEGRRILTRNIIEIMKYE